MWIELALDPPPKSMAARRVRVLLGCGLLSSLWYAAMNIVVPLQAPEYSQLSQTISELSAVDAPTRVLWGWLGVFYTLLVTAFGWAVGRSESRRQRSAASLPCIRLPPLSSC